LRSSQEISGGRVGRMPLTRNESIAFQIDRLNLYCLAWTFFSSLDSARFLLQTAVYGLPPDLQFALDVLAVEKVVDARSVAGESERGKGGWWASHLS
jgi:hypothetical protein